MNRELTKEQAAARMSVSVRSFERYCRAHGVVPCRWDGRSPRFEREDVLALGLIVAAEKNAANGYGHGKILTVAEAKGKAKR